MNLAFGILDSLLTIAVSLSFNFGTQRDWTRSENQQPTIFSEFSIQGSLKVQIIELLKLI